MNILIIGSGGREHALATSLTSSPLCDALFAAPGNVGTSALGTNLPIGVTDFEEIKNAILKHEIDMLVIGPEVPLVLGLRDFLEETGVAANCMVVGPDRAGAMLEGSKDFAKDFMTEYNIPTAQHKTFSAAEINEALEHLDTHPLPVVLKADGLAAGKGVIIATETEAAKANLLEMLDGKFGEAGARVVIESFMDGIEFSVFALTDGSNYVVLPTAKDYKRIGEGDTGLNTGGMGAVSPPPFVTPEIMQRVRERVIEPTISGLKDRGITYKGFLFLGFMLVGDDPMVVEYNCRLGDPETEAVLPRLKTDLVELFIAMHQGRLDEIDIEEDDRAAATIVLASGGYPEKYDTGFEITGVNDLIEGKAFHAGTKMIDGSLVTSGGRVLAVTALGRDWKEAVALANKNAGHIQFQNRTFRKDIGYDL